MKPRLYPSDAVSFKNMGYGQIDAISCTVTETLNGEYDLHMTMLNTDANFNNIQVGNIIAAKPNNTDPIQAFCIEEISKAINGEVEIYATHIAQFRSKLIPVANYTATSLSDAIDKAFTNSLESNPFTFTTDKTIATSYTLNAPRSFRELLGGREGSLLDIYGGEYYFDNFKIQLLLHRGHDNGVRIFYGKNMTDFNASDMFGWNDSATGVLPYWYSDEDGLVVGSIQYSPYESQYKYKRTIVKDYTEEFEDKPTSSDLNDAASAWVSNKGLNTENISVSFDDLVTENGGKLIMLGDTVHVINTRYNVNYTSRIVKTEYNVLLEKYDYIEVGTLSQTINEAISDTVSDETANGSGGGGGMNMELLWTNPSPTSSFAAQTVSIANLSDYKYLIIVVKATKSAGTYQSQILFPSVRHRVVFNGSTLTYRDVDFVANGLDFLAARNQTTYGGSTTQNNDLVIPVYIYGIK